MDRNFWSNVVSWLLNNAPALFISLAALIVSIRSWYQTRIFYDLDMYQISGYGSDGRLDIIKQKLITGKYTILNTYEETHAGNRNTIFILVGKIKK
jgi:hypothetical protein